MVPSSVGSILSDSIASATGTASGTMREVSASSAAAATRLASACLRRPLGAAAGVFQFGDPAVPLGLASLDEREDARGYVRAPVAKPPVGVSDARVVEQVIVRRVFFQSG